MASYHPPMPVPKPSGGESKNDFIGRCISTLTNAGEFDSDEQRQAVCHTAWREKKMAETKARTRYQPEKAPEGGATVGGTFFPGGQFIPTETAEQATADVKERAEASDVFDEEQITGLLGVSDQLMAGEIKDADSLIDALSALDISSGDDGDAAVQALGFTDQDSSSGGLEEIDNIIKGIEPEPEEEPPDEDEDEEPFGPEGFGKKAKRRKGLMGYLDRFRKRRRKKMATATKYHGEIGARVQKLREEKDMSQEELAERMSDILDPEAGTGVGGIDVSTIGQIEAGDIDVPSQPVIAAFAEALDTSVEALEGLLGEGEEPGSGRFRRAQTRLVYRGVFRPRVTEQDNGNFTIHRVPIFLEHEDHGFKCDSAWMKAAVRKQRKESKDGVFPRLIIGHTSEDGDEKPAVASLDNFTHSTSKGTLYADYVNVTPELMDQFKNNNWPGRSVEVYPEEHDITAVAILGGTPPFFKLPDLRLNAKREHAGIPVMYSMEVPTMSKKDKKGKQYMMDEEAREEVVQVVAEVLEDVLEEKFEDFRRSFAGHPDEDDSKHKQRDDEDEETEEEKEEMKKMASTKIGQRYSALKHDYSALQGRVIELEDANERARWFAQYSTARIPAGRISIKDEVEFIMELPSDKRESYFKRTLRNLKGPSTKPANLDDAAKAAGYQRGSQAEADAINEHYEANKAKYRGDKLRAARDYRLQLASGSNGKK